MSRLDTLIETNPIPTWRQVAWPIMILLAVLLVWANFAQRDEVSIATGEVVPQGKVKVIQHLEGGIVEEIFIQEGDAVREGDPLIQLDLASGGTNKAELEVRLDGLKLQRVRYAAEAKGAEPEFPVEIGERRPTLVAAEERAFAARKLQLESATEVLRQQVRQKELELQELQARKRAVSRNLELSRERLKLSTSLLAEGLTPKLEHLQMEAEVESLEGEMQGLVPAIPKAESAISEAEERVEEEEIKFRRQAEDEVGKVERDIARVEELLAKATGQEVRAEIKSPIDGIVKNMRYNTIGGVVKPGEPIMEIVPTGGRLVVEGKLPPTDRGFVNKGQRTVVKISTYDFTRYGGLEGEVILVAPDSSQDEAGNPYFRVLVQTEKTYLGEVEGDLPITPGMQATIDIHTGQKSFMEYLIKPVLKLRHEAFRER